MRTGGLDEIDFTKTRSQSVGGIELEVGEDVAVDLLALDKLQVWLVSRILRDEMEGRESGRALCEGQHAKTIVTAVIGSWAGDIETVGRQVVHTSAFRAWIELAGCEYIGSISSFSNMITIIFLHFEMVVNKWDCWLSIILLARYTLSQYANTLSIRALIGCEERAGERRAFKGSTTASPIRTEMFAIAEIKCVSIERGYL